MGLSDNVVVVIVLAVLAYLFLGKRTWTIRDGQIVQTDTIAPLPFIPWSPFPEPVVRYDAPPEMPAPTSLPSSELCNPASKYFVGWRVAMSPGGCPEWQDPEMF